MKNIYEILDEFEVAQTEKEKMQVIEKNLSKTLVNVLLFTYHPNFQWMVKELPHNFKFKPVPVGLSINHLGTELRKLYLFLKNDSTAEKLTDKKRNELLLQLLESIEPREAEVVMGIFNKDLGVTGLNYKFVKKAFPNLLP